VSEKNRWSVLDDSAARGDLRTLALATPPLDAAKLEQLVTFQRSMVEQLRQVPHPARQGSSWEHWLAKAHDQAVALSGLTHQELSRMSALCSDYCSKRRSELELQRRRDQLAANKDPAKAETLAELDKALARLAASTTLKERYGEASIALLQTREQELLDLHEELWRPV